MLTNYLIWRPEAGENEDYAKKVNAWSAEDAAATEAERQHADCDYPTMMTFSVQALEEDGSPGGPILTVHVEAVPTVHFLARLAKEK